MDHFTAVRPKSCYLHTCTLELISVRRASENLHFFTVRDSTSTIQIVSRDKALSAELMALPLESVVQLEGSVRSRKSKSKPTASASSSSSSLQVRCIVNLPSRH